MARRNRVYWPAIELPGYWFCLTPVEASGKKLGLSILGMVTGNPIGILVPKFLGNIIEWQVIPPP